MLALLLSLAAAPLAPSALDLLPKAADSPGCVLDARRGGRTLEAVATGLANLEHGAPITADTVFEIGSVSKQFVGAGIAYLALHGRLTLNDPVRKWLPELPPLYRDVTVAMLLHHTSGIRSWNNLAELTGRGEDSTGYDNAWVLQALARQTRLNNRPGAEYLYSNSNFVLAAIIVERASGQLLDDFFRAALFNHLGLTRTRWRTDFTAIVQGRAQAYLPDDQGGWRVDMPLNGVAGAGGLLSTAGDLQRWNAALANPAAEDRGWVALLLTPGALADGTTLPYGLGIDTNPIAGAPAFSHAGSTGSYRAWLGFFPAERLSIALLCNSGAVNTEDLGPEVAARFLAKEVPAPPLSGPPTSAPAELAGLYRNTASDAVVEAKVDAAGLHFNNGPGFGASGQDRLVTADGRRTATVRRNPNGSVSGMTVSRIANAPITLARVAAWAPSQRELARWTGTYTSPEVDGQQRIEICDGTLVWRDPSGAAHRLEAIYPSAFYAADASWTLRFNTGRHGPTLNMSITRARKISFRRQIRLE